MAEILPDGRTRRDSAEKSMRRLVPLTDIAVGARTSRWFLHMTFIFLVPLFFAQFISMLLPSQLPFSKVFQIYECPAAIVVLYGHSLVLLLVYVNMFSPTLIPFERIALGLLAKIHYRRTHIIHLRSDRFKKLLAQRPYTIFVVPAHGQRSIPIVVSNITTTRDIIDRLVILGAQPRFGYGQTHALYTSGRHPRPLKEGERLGDLTSIGDLSHFFIRCPTFGGAPITPTRNHRSGYTQTPDSPSTNTRSHTNSSHPSTPSSMIDSPAKNTRSKKSITKQDKPSAVLVSPRKPRRKRGDLTDLEVWDWSDDKIIAEARDKWSSDAYNHFNMVLERVYRRDGSPLRLDFAFICRYDPQTHKKQMRGRMQTGWGTTNLIREIKKCCAARGVKDNEDTSAGAQQTIERSISQYSPARHRALIAVRCAESKRPFNSVQDPRYLEEVELLRPGTVVPSPSTVSRDAGDIYTQGSIAIKKYFEKYAGSIHLVIDGWTAPFAYSYLGIVIIWFAQGKIWRSILEFIRLKESHTGQYLAGATADCLRRFGLEQKFHTINMDNASNCDTTADHLEELIPTFRGKLSRSRCFAHTVNLIAKAFLSFFHERPTRKAPKVSKGTRKNRKTGVHRTSAVATTSTTIVPDSPRLDGDIDMMGPEDQTQGASVNSASSALLADEGNGEEDGDNVDSAKVVHDEAAVKTISGEAERLARLDCITMSVDERSAALALFPKVAGLARKLHDSPTLQERFERCVSADLDLNSDTGGQKKRLDRRVPTRWNSDFACLKAHIHFQNPIRQLTADRRNGLDAYALTEEQWKLAEQLEDVLEIFQNITDLFSQAEVPLVHEVVPMLEDLEHEMDEVYKDHSLPNVIRVAARAALLMVGKYYALTDDNEVYRIAMAMCPDKKAVWFDKNPDWRPEDREEVKRLLHQRWSESYEGRLTAQAASVAKHESARPRKRSRWALPPVELDSSSSLNPDSMDAYLSTALVSRAEIVAAGGYLKYWEREQKTRPRLAQMALDFLSAPASSVDAERAFSGGRLQMGHLQHGMSSQSFKGQVAIGSWIGTPLMPDLDVATSIVASKIRRADKGKGKEKEVVDTLPSSVINVDSDSDA